MLFVRSAFALRSTPFELGAESRVLCFSLTACHLSLTACRSFLEQSLLKTPIRKSQTRRSGVHDADVALDEREANRHELARHAAIVILHHRYAVAGAVE